MSLSHLNSWCGIVSAVWLFMALVANLLGTARRKSVNIAISLVRYRRVCAYLVHLA